MSVIDDTNKVINRINNIYERRITAVYYLAQFYSSRAANYFNIFQSQGRFWINRTSQAKNRFFSEAFKEFTAIGFFVAHGVDYGVYLELANNRRHEAIRPIIQRFLFPFITDVKKIYKD